MWVSCYFCRKPKQPTGRWSSSLCTGPGATTSGLSMWVSANADTMKIVPS